MKRCIECGGTGVRPYDPSKKPCHACKGRGHFDPPDEQDIRQKIFSRRKPGRLVSKRPTDSRAYFVWRLARFRGGRDTAAPIMAYVETFGDPFIPELEQLANVVAKEVFGT